MLINSLLQTHLMPPFPISLQYCVFLSHLFTDVTHLFARVGPHFFGKTPLPVQYGALHTQENEPIVLMHFALESHGDFSALHSSMSWHLCKLPTKDNKVHTYNASYPMYEIAFITECVP